MLMGLVWSSGRLQCWLAAVAPESFYRIDFQPGSIAIFWRRWRFTVAVLDFDLYPQIR